MINPPFQAIIFDLDGTLIDTIEDLANTVNQLLSNHQLPLHSIDAYRIKVGDGIQKLIERSLPSNTPQNNDFIQILMEEFKNEYQKNWKQKTHPYPGIMQMLHDLERQSIKKGILSNKPQHFTDLCVKHFFPEVSFDLVRGAQKGIPHKPDPLSALDIATSFEVDPGRVIYVGDTAIDMQTAVNAGMYAVGVEWGFRDRKELIEHGAQAVLQSPKELILLI